ncbi:Sensory neuron membrane protein 1, partial [Gryllus bimaculatus]
MRRKIREKIRTDKKGEKDADDKDDEKDGKDKEEEEEEEEGIAFISTQYYVFYIHPANHLLCPLSFLSHEPPYSVSRDERAAGERRMRSGICAGGREEARASPPVPDSTRGPRRATVCGRRRVRLEPTRTGGADSEPRVRYMPADVDVMALPADIDLSERLQNELCAYFMTTSDTRHVCDSQSKMLKGGSDTRMLWASFPEPLDFRVYLFNVTNPDAVHAGAKPIMQEVGPYFYGEYKTKENLADNMANDTVSYNQRVRWVFNREKSGGLTGDEMITMPHPLIGLVGALERTKPGMLGMIGKALPVIHRQPAHAFMTATAHQILFGGVPVSCDVSDFSAKAVCGALKKDGKDFHWVSDKEFTFSFFGHKNNTLDPHRLEVKRGIQNIADLGRVVSWKGEPKMAVSIAATYDRDIVHEGIPGRRYTADFGDQSSVPDEKCFCAAEDQVYNLPCPQGQILASRQLKRLTEPSCPTGQIDLTPVKITGTPLEARKRLQFSLPIHPVEKVALLANVPTALVPLFWVEEGLALPQMYVDQLKSSLFRAMKIMGILKWVMMAAGVGMGGVGGFLLYKKKQELALNSISINSNPSK